MSFASSYYQGAGRVDGGPWNEIAVNSAYFVNQAEPTTPQVQQAQDASAMLAAQESPIAARGPLGKPASWWVMLALVFAVMVFISRRYGGSEKFGNLRMSLWNMMLLTVFYVIMLNFLKVVFSYVRVPGLSELIKAA